MSADPDSEGGGFHTGLEIARRREAEAGRPALPVPVDAYVIEPVVDLERAKKGWNAFLALKATLLLDEACYDDIAGKREMNRTGATRLATAFGLSQEVVSVLESDPVAEDGKPDHRFLVRVRVSRAARYADGVASCRLSEIEAKTKKGEAVPISQREHFALTRAATRALKRAIADILGGTEAE